MVVLNCSVLDDDDNEAEAEAEVLSDETVLRDDKDGKVWMCSVVLGMIDWIGFNNFMSMRMFSKNMSE